LYSNTAAAAASVVRRSIVIGQGQGDHLSGKPGNVMEIETCQGNVRDNDNSQGNVIEKSCQGKVSQNCSLVDEYLRSYGYLVASMHSFYAHRLRITPFISPLLRKSWLLLPKH